MERIQTTPAPLLVFLVRHGETVANAERRVTGQSQSPLTSRGKDQARALSTSRLFRPHSWYRVYASDLERTQETARLILLNGNNNNFQLDTRLREIAKGAREGLDKSMTEEQAVCHKRATGNTVIPLLETLDQGWHRIKDWWDQLLHECGTTTATEVQQSEPRRILVVSHAGILRVFLQRIFDPTTLHHQTGNRARYDADGRLIIPNCSVTILRVDFVSNTGNSSDHAARPVVTIEQLTDTSHYNDAVQT